VARLEQILEKADCPISLVKVDMSRKKRLAQRYNVEKVPTVLLLKDGNVIRDISEDFSNDRIKGYLEIGHASWMLGNDAGAVVDR